MCSIKFEHFYQASQPARCRVFDPPTYTFAACSGGFLDSQGRDFLCSQSWDWGLVSENSWARMPFIYKESSHAAAGGLTGPSTYTPDTGSWWMGWFGLAWLYLFKNLLLQRQYIFFAEYQSSRKKQQNSATVLPTSDNKSKYVGMYVCICKSILFMKES